MKRKESKIKSVIQRIANQAQERRISRNDALLAYAMDRLLYRLGRSSQVREFFLKGGVLVANLMAAPHRFTRDIDLLRSHGPSDPDDIRQRFQEIAAITFDDGVFFDASSVRAGVAIREMDGYDGVRVTLQALVGESEVEIHIDIGFGDAVIPPAERLSLVTFLEGDLAAEVYAYEVGPVLAEKIETLIGKFPLVEHRLKDLLDVVVLSNIQAFDGQELLASLHATFDRRQTLADVQVLDRMAEAFRGRKWMTHWAVMRKEKAVSVSAELPDVVAAFDGFVRPLLKALGGESMPQIWLPGGPWGKRSG